MEAERQSSTSEVTSKTGKLPNTVSPGTENSSLLITCHKLNGYNYLQWSSSVMMFICGKGRDDYLTGEATMPGKEDPQFRNWKTENHMIMSWLINSMTNEIGENFLLYGTAKEIWDAARETYSNSDNTSELFEIEAALHDLRQGELNVTQYFNTLTRHWQQLDMFEVHTWKCSGDTVLFRRIVEQKRTFKFLLGLNKTLDEVRGRIMGTKPLPSLRETFSEVRREESRKKVMMGSHNSGPSMEGSALVSRASSWDSRKKGRPWCDHCQKPGHTKETCWKIHGKPSNWKPSRLSNDKESRAYVAAISDDNRQRLNNTPADPFTKEQLEILQKLFSQNSTTTGSGMAAQKGTESTGFGFGEEDWQC
ncbi:Retrovirus-related polyprotein from transposon [Salix suchowensis]|nr:Retrovirus-related polyprotein from transposon [Salix suchowensis]KAG5250156.1 Retrovirus-related polyprotein from transposon [Salix suchowensis]